MGPLKGVRIVEMAGLGPAPFCGMLLADMGAEVIRIDRPGAENLLGLKYDILNRGRSFIELDLKNPADVEKAKALIARADGLIEGFRPGVMERLGLGPDIFQQVNPKLVYGRMTGWGQTGPLAQAAGHDINYIALSGALAAIGTDEQPLPPLNLVGDFGGGALYLAFGMVCGLLEARGSGKGQVIDAAITDGTAHLMAMIYALRHAGAWKDGRGLNVLDGSASFYGTYRCKDDRFVAIGPIEPKFYALLIEKLGLDPVAMKRSSDPAAGVRQKKMLADAFLTRTRDEWTALLEGTDVCFAPVLDMGEAPDHPHNRARGIFVEHQGVTQPAPAPRFSRTVPELSDHSQSEPSDWAAVARAWGVSV